jgi:predicted Zn-dependent protease
VGCSRRASSSSEACSAQGLGLLFLQNGRDAERQADDLGFRYALGRGYAMSEMSDVFRALERLTSPDQSALPTFLSSHPSPGASCGND